MKRGDKYKLFMGKRLITIEVLAVHRDGYIAYRYSKAITHEPIIEIKHEKEISKMREKVS
jgi:hypothetical protein